MVDIQNQPVEKQSGLLAIAQVYGEAGEGPKLNEVVEVVGLLSRAPDLAVPPHPDGPQDLLMEELAARPPTSQVSLPSVLR